MVASLDYISPLVSGIIVALASWLPIGPEGHAVSGLLESLAPSYGDYLVPSYLGIIFAVLFYFKNLIALDTQSAIKGRVSSDLRYFFYASIFTILIGYPVIRGLEDAVSPATSDLINAVIGLLLIALGLIYRGRKLAPLEDVEGRIREDENEATLLDSIVSGITQGAALIGSVSRSGLVLLGLSSTGIDVKRALELSFLVAPVYFVLKLLFMTWNPELPVSLLFTAFLSAFVVSLITMKLLLKMAEALGRRRFLIVFGSIAVVVYLLGVMM
ncbi:bacilysin biosynthesis protein BacA [Thermococcus siculi]|uniref:Undecaprenyl-diphosphatase n=1 Tax=Thermococcus siculi TaxID=72803 RepID=A0A2Z2MQF7_9EURY|nr:undecaprenyl-diphosphate phosphatase [Thermococcus siculi]ASJ08877.1 bacilysin biosynthesis protein BacA [Thermococcus siculi]